MKKLIVKIFYTSPNDESLPASTSYITFFTAMLFGCNYCNFKGRASRKEWWGVHWLDFWFSLLIYGFVYQWFPNYLEVTDIIYILYTIIPFSALMVRRSHDINLNPLWCLSVIPIFLLPFMKGENKDNRYGKNIY